VVPVHLIKSKKILRFLEKSRAVSRETAIPVSDIPFSNQRTLMGLIEREIVREAGDRVYLDVENMKVYLNRRRTFAFGLIFFVAVIFLVYYLV
jgi:hypothetical protein